MPISIIKIIINHKRHNTILQMITMHWKWMKIFPINFSCATKIGIYGVSQSKLSTGRVKIQLIEIVFKYMQTLFFKRVKVFKYKDMKCWWSRCCSYSVWLCGLYYETLHVLTSSRAIFPRISSFLLALLSACLGKRELVYVLLVRLFVCLFCTC